MVNPEGRPQESGCDVKANLAKKNFVTHIARMHRWTDRRDSRNSDVDKVQTLVAQKS